MAVARAARAGPQAYEGGVTIRAGGRLLGREDFSLGEGTEAGGVTVALTTAGACWGRGRARGGSSVRTRGAPRAGRPQVTLRL